MEVFIIKNILILIFISQLLLSCDKGEDVDKFDEYGALEFEKYLTTLLARRDSLEFSQMFAKAPDITTVNNLKEMTVIYDLLPRDIIRSIKNFGVVYRRIFAPDDGSVSAYLPTEGGYYDVSTTYRKYKNSYITQIRYSTPDDMEVNLIEFVGLYQDNKWRLLTINFLDSAI